MRETQLSLRELGLVAGTRAALGAGLALLLGDRLTPRERKVFGWALMLAGVATTIPLAADILGRSRVISSNTPGWRNEMELART
ncbi:MAG: hypothetical protein K8U57_38730 [Planctomycetes bacterium]|nr:hypothetical protein [Planctomycetota bacterium]